MFTHGNQAVAGQSPAEKAQAVRRAAERNAPPAPQPPRPIEVMQQMIGGFWVSRVVWAVAELGIADLLAGPTSVEELAAKTGTHAGALYRVLRAAASVGIFRELPGRRFKPSPLGDTLKSEGESLRALARSELGGVHYPSWGEMMFSIQTGKPSFDHVFGEPCFEYWAKRPEKGALFDQSMTEISKLVEAAVLEAFDFGGYGPRIVDVGGGRGSLLAAICARHATLRGTVYDAPHVVAGAPKVFAERGVTGRVDTASGDFFASVPGGADTYLMKHIIHDWDDAKCIKILRNCREAGAPGSRVLIVDQVLPGPNEPSFGKFSDLIMLLLPGGLERTADEFGALLDAAGWKLKRIVPTRSPMSVIEAERA